MKKVRIGVVGAGHLGKIHLKILKDLPVFELAGFYDQDAGTSAAVSKELNIPYCSDMEELMGQCEALDIVTNTISHYECASQAIKLRKHVFIEKPLANSLQEAEQLVALADAASITAQVGHVERFNPAYLALAKHRLQPMFIESHRLAQFNPRGTDVPVVLDLMIHDIDIILQLVKSPAKQINASGVPVISPSHDIVNARIEFENGCVANITASRISLKQMRKMRLFQKDGYISIDFLEKKTEIIRLEDKHQDSIDPFGLTIKTPSGEERILQFERPEIQPLNSIKRELELFHESISSSAAPPVTFRDGLEAMRVAYQIMDKIKIPNLAN